jgi:hypothetical protein
LLTLSGGTCIPPASTSWVAGITAVYHHAWLFSSSLFSLSSLLFLFLLPHAGNQTQSLCMLGKCTIELHPSSCFCFCFCFFLSCCVAQACLEFTMKTRLASNLSSGFPECWNYRCAPPQFALLSFLKEAIVFIGKVH